MRQPGITIDDILALGRVQERSEVQNEAAARGRLRPEVGPGAGIMAPAEEANPVAPEEGEEPVCSCGMNIGATVRRGGVDMQGHPCTQAPHDPACPNCGLTPHPIRECPARGHKCYICECADILQQCVVEVREIADGDNGVRGDGAHLPRGKGQRAWRHCINK